MKLNVHSLHFNNLALHFNCEWMAGFGRLGWERRMKSRFRDAAEMWDHNYRFISAHVLWELDWVLPLVVLWLSALLSATRRPRLTSSVPQPSPQTTEISVKHFVQFLYSRYSAITINSNILFLSTFSISIFISILLSVNLLISYRE